MISIHANQVLQLATVGRAAPCVLGSCAQQCLQCRLTAYDLAGMLTGMPCCML